MKNSKSIIDQFFLEDIFKDVLKDEEANSTFDSNLYIKQNESCLDYYKRMWNKICKQYTWLNKNILYCDFRTKSLVNQTDRWILLGVLYRISDKKPCIVWWNYIDKELFSDYTLNEFFEDLACNTYKITHISH